MRILLVNKFLYPRGGAENYVLRLGEALKKRGCEVEFFGMEGENQVGNSAGIYAPAIDFNSGAANPVRVLYSKKARKSLSLLMEQFRPDIVHLNNISYQITPSIIYEIKKFGAAAVLTAHDYQLICPNYLLRRPDGTLCQGCIGGSYAVCIKNRCVHLSAAKTLLAAAENAMWRRLRAYSLLDAVICPSRFIAEKLSVRSDIREKIVVMPSFANARPRAKGEFVLYFGRLAEEKGIRTLLKVCGELKNIPFVFAGDGPMRYEIDRLALPNVQCVGFLSGKELQSVLNRAMFTVHPSEWYENCSLSLIESLSGGIPAIGANIGGISEFIIHEKNGLLFKSGSAGELGSAIERLWSDRGLLERLSKGCAGVICDEDSYCEKIIELYNSIMV